MADSPPRILGFEFTDEKFLRNDMLSFCFNNVRNVLLKRNKTEENSTCDQEEEKYHPSPLS